MFQDWEKWLQLIRWSFAPAHFLPANSVTQCCSPVSVTVYLHPCHIQASHLHSPNCQFHSIDTGSLGSQVWLLVLLTVLTLLRKGWTFSQLLKYQLLEIYSHLRPLSILPPFSERGTPFSHASVCQGHHNFLQANTLKACDSVQCTLNSVRH